MNKKIIVMGIIELLIFISISPCFTSTENDENPLIDIKYLVRPRRPIVIHGNNDFKFRNGVRWGKGTEENPYIISRWFINGHYPLFTLENPFNSSGLKLFFDIFRLALFIIYSDTGIAIINTNRHVIIRNNFIVNYKSPDPHEPYHKAILLINTENVIIEDNFIEVCDFGIHYIENNRALTIRDNQIGNARRSAIIGGSNALIEDNFIYDCNRGIYVEDNSIIQHNRVFHAVHQGILIEKNCIVSHNALIGCDIGIGGYSSAGSSIIVENEIQGNELGIYLSSGSNPGIHYNNIYQNNWGIEYIGGSSVNASYNWWGAKNGPSGYGSGSGDPIDSDIMYTPWLEEKNPNAGP